MDEHSLPPRPRVRGPDRASIGGREGEHAGRRGEHGDPGLGRRWQSWLFWLMGGLNYQIEHHHFPGTPRPHLSRARQLVRQHCWDHAVPYTENSQSEALRIVTRYMNEVGVAASADLPLPDRGRASTA